MTPRKKTADVKLPELATVPVERCVALRRNPQFLTPHTMEALKTSIRRDGFLAPVLLRPTKTGDFEVLSGNHRVMAARELGIETIPAVITTMDDASAGRVAVNLNTVHGDPTAELLAPFLAELDDDTLGSVHLADDLLAEVADFDRVLADRLAELDVPDSWNHDSPQTPQTPCTCPTCGRRHIKAESEQGE